MSHQIEYQARAFVLNGSELCKDRFVVAIQSGPSNMTATGPSGRERRVRDWGIAMVGTRDQVMRQAVRAAASCEGRLLTVQGKRSITPEFYIARMRRLLNAASPDFDRHVVLFADVPLEHPLVPAAQAQGWTVYMTATCRLIPPAQDAAFRQQFFELIEPHLDAGSIDPRQVGQVFGMPDA